MASDQTQYEAAAARLRDAYSGETLPPMRDVLSPTDVDGAYAIQAVNTRAWSAEGRKIIGRKVGLTAKAVQQQLGVDQPDFGVLFDDMQVPNGGTLSPSSCIQPKAEAEIAIILKSDLRGESVSRADVLAATGQVAAAIEIVDSRISDWKITFADTVADNGSSAFFVLGDATDEVEALDLYTCGMVMEINGEIASLGAGAACLGHPLDAAAWLASTLAARGEHLKAGDIVLTGALGPMVALTPGDKILVKIGGLGTCKFEYGKG
ncbi:fumarylacetoacetate hydrolase family protein [Henriciella sp. AS95]|uniref:2-keto-4-pentenoate hydratase n=1 Tax=Henriciella sp. AS95 TaxID=3135782 RepID=UPI0031723556